MKSLSINYMDLFIRPLFLLYKGPQKVLHVNIFLLFWGSKDQKTGKIHEKCQKILQTVFNNKVQQNVSGQGLQKSISCHFFLPF